MWAIIVGFVALLAMRVLPTMNEFFTILGVMVLVFTAYYLGWQRGLKHMAEHVVRTRDNDGKEA